MTTLDPRVTPARPDLAATHLRGKVEAERFADGVPLEVVAPTAPLRRTPSPEASLDTEALFGERVTVYEATAEGWAWGQLAIDDYVGWLPAQALAPAGPAATHIVAVPRTFLYPAPDIKAPPLMAVPMGARLAVTDMDGRFARTASGAFAVAHHLRTLDAAPEPDFVAVAERLLGVPYLWGGRSPLGLDCSGLVQLALAVAGKTAPRDSDMQEKALGRPTDPRADFARVKRGDLMFWKGHVAIVSDPATIVHANAHHMMVALEPLRPAVERIRASGFDVTSVRRL